MKLALPSLFESIIRHSPGQQPLIDGDFNQSTAAPDGDKRPPFRTAVKKREKPTLRRGSNRSDFGPQLLEHMVVSPEYVYSFAISDNIAYAGCCTGAIYRYDMASKHDLLPMNGHRDVVRKLEVVCNEEDEDVHLYSVSKDKTCRGWEVRLLASA